MTILVYTHTDVSWVHPYWHKQTDKYLEQYDKIMFTNNGVGVDRPDYQVIEYDDTQTYRERMLSCLSQLDEDLVVVFHHEDMFLYDTPNYNLLNEMESLVNSDKVHLIKLLRNGQTLDQFESYPYLYYNYDGFSIQPTIAKVRTLKQIFSEIQGDSIWSFEHNSMGGVNKLGYVNLMIYDGQNQRGSNHWDSSIYPYVATAVVKGQWNGEYTNELQSIKHG